MLMKTFIKIAGITILSLMMLFNNVAFGQKKNAPVRVLLITGGHDFHNSLDAYMGSLPGIVVTHVKHPNALSMFRPENRSSWDVALLYDTHHIISDQEKKDFTDCFKEGKGLVIWHHATASYRDWPEYKEIMGGRYHLTPWTDSKGVSHPASTYKHDVHFRVKVADKKHPVTKGIKDFDILDETYGAFYVNPGIHILLTTNEPSSVSSVAWAKRYGKAKVVTILLGHDEKAWNNPNHKKLLTQAILWAK